MKAGWSVVMVTAALGMLTYFAARDLPLADKSWAADALKPATRPVPIEKTNCVKCHLTAGRELTDAVDNFAQSAHDMSDFSCHKCHGGNLNDDAHAHEPQFGFIGNKLSAHLKNCRSCHVGEAAGFAKGPHYWNHDKQLNTKFPLCVDCHGNHDIGKPPENFRLTLVCLDCHKDYESQFPAYAVVTAQHDRLWEAIRAWQKSHSAAPGRVPGALQDDLDHLRAETAALIHPAGKIRREQAERLKTKIADFRHNLAGTTAARPE